MVRKAMMVSLRGQYAGFVSRLIAFMIDTSIISLTVFLISWIIRTTADIASFETGLIISASLANTLRVIFEFLISPPMLILYTNIIFALYHIFFLVLAGATPGKAIIGLRVVGTDGKPLNFSRALLRVMGYIPSITALFVGFLWIIIDNRRQAWHDKIARTCVIYAWEARPDERFLAIPIKRMNLLPNLEGDETEE